jgi:hypothetical protein
MPLLVFPSVDLALVPGSSVALKIMAHVVLSGQQVPTWTDVGSTQGFTLTSSNLPAAIATQAGTTITAVAAGEAIPTFDVHSSTTTASFLLRVRVFDSVATLYTPRAQLKLETDRSDRVLSVYALMARGAGRTLCDVTSHPYLVYASDNNAVAEVDPLGRIKTKNQAGTAKITISLAAGTGAAAPLTVTLTVAAPVTDRPILTLRKIATAPSPRAILFLSEGFTSTQQAQFDAVVREAHTRLFANVEPYKTAVGAFEVYSAFVPSDEAGITIGPPAGPMTGQIRRGVPPSASPDLAARLPLVIPPTPTEYGLSGLIAEVGLVGPTSPTTLANALTTWTNLSTPAKLTAQVFQGWRLFARDLGFFRPRESFFGLCYGGRLAGPYHADVPPANGSAQGAFYVPRIANESITFDTRRVPDLTDPANDPDVAHQKRLDDFLKSLRRSGGQANEGERWASGHDDFGLVCFVVNDDAVGGTQFAGGMAASVGTDMRFKITPVAGMPGLLDHEPVWMNVAQPAIRNLGFSAPSYDITTDRIGHELTHAFRLFDEYSGGPAPGATMLQFRLRDALNVMPRALVAGAGNTLRPPGLRWFALPRVEQAAPAVSVRLDGAGTQVIVEVPAPVAGQDRRPSWDKIAAGRVVQLRALRRRRNPPSALLTIVSFDAAKNELTLAPPAGVVIAQYPLAFGKDAAVLLVRSDASGPLTVLRAAVAADLAANGPLAAPPTCDVPGPNQMLPRAIAGVTPPRLQYRLIGAYVGGAQYNCDVLRPCGGCKMRTVIETPGAATVDFCFVCMYSMLEDSDIAALGILDRSYP